MIGCHYGSLIPSQLPSPPFTAETANLRSANFMGPVPVQLPCPPRILSCSIHQLFIDCEYRSISEPNCELVLH